jgi:hypothetical protein
MSAPAGLLGFEVQPLGWTLLHFVWQGTLAAGSLAAAHVLLRPRSARLRYGLAGGTLAVMFMMAVGTFVVERASVARTRSW